MSCSTSTTATPSAATSRSTALNAAVSCSSWPLAGSSSSSTFGAVASARASSTTRAWPVGSRSARWPAELGDAEALEELVGDLVGMGAPGGVGGQPDVLAHGEQAEGLEPLEGAGQPAARPLERGQLR